MAFIEIDCVEEDENTGVKGHYKAMIDVNEIESFLPDWDADMNEIDQTRIFFKSGGLLTANIPYRMFKKIFLENETKYIAFNK